jgi:polysaccharide export outer membrane protein
MASEQRRIGRPDGSSTRAARRVRGRWLVAAGLTAALSAAGPGAAFAQARTPAAAAPVPPPANADLGEYRIGPEDVLQIAVWKNDAMSRAVTVRPDGKISLPLLNEIQAAGLTPTELKQAIVKQLTEYMPSPEVSIIVIEYRSFKVSIIGEVPKPGRYELKSWTTMLDLLALAGGFNQFSARGKIFVLRPEGSAMKRIPFNYNKAVSEGGEQENFYLRAGDIVVVP